MTRWLGGGLVRWVGAGLVPQRPSFESVVVQSQGSGHRIDTSDIRQFGGGLPNGRRNVSSTNSALPPRVHLLSEFTQLLLKAVSCFVLLRQACGVVKNAARTLS